MIGMFKDFVTPPSPLYYFCNPPIFHEKKLYDPSAFSWPAYSVENDSPQVQGLYSEAQNLTYHNLQHFHVDRYHHVSAATPRVPR